VQLFADNGGARKVWASASPTRAMSTDTDKYDIEGERESRHSALEELARDERRPAVVLLSALLLAAIFFAFGIMFGRWTVQTGSQTRISPNSSTQTPPTANSGTTPQLASATPPPPLSPSTRAGNQERRFTLLIENLASKEAAQSLIKSLERAGYRDARTGKRQPVPDSTLSVMVGHYDTREEAEAEATRLRASGGPRLKNVRVIEDKDDSPNP
jgi:septal ring-binding cell division protein DamX